MNFNQFVVRNTLRNKHLYLAYFLSTMFSVLVFFTFNVFAFHPKLAGDNLQSQAQMGMFGAAVIIYIFSFFFVWYSMDIFLQSRKKEFGMLMIQGMSPRQLKKMVFVENLVIGFFATIIGSLAGVGFSQVILWISKKLMNIDFGFYFPTKAIGITLGSFILLFLVISFFIRARLPKLNVQELLKAGELGKGKIKTSPFLALLGIVLVGAGYFIALTAPGASIIVVFLPVVLLVVVGTKFLFDQFSVFIVERLRKTQNLFWKKTNMVVFSDLAFRMKDNARSFYLVAVISTVAFAAIGSLYGFRQMIVGAMDESRYEFMAYDANPEAAKLIEDQLQKYGLKDNRIEYTSYFGEGYQVVKESEYNKVASSVGDPEIHLPEGQVAQLQMKGDQDASAELTEATIGGQAYKVSEMVSQTMIAASQATVVVPDTMAIDGYKEDKTLFWIDSGASKEQQIEIGKAISTNNDAQGTAFVEDVVIQSYAPVLFVGIFIGIVFFVSAGSFLYFRLYSDMDLDIEKFKMIFKMGLSKKELKKMINQQLGILFFTPILVSLTHGAIALTTMYHMFKMNMQVAGWQVLGAFLLIQVIYYLVARTFYFRKVYKAVQA